MEAATERKREGMNGTAGRIGKRHAGQMRSNRHPIAGLLVAGITADSLERRADLPGRLEGEPAGDRRGDAGDEGLDRVDERIHPRRGSDSRREAVGERRIDDGDVGEEQRIDDSHLRAGGRVGEDRHEGRLRTGAGRRRHEDRRHPAAPGTADADIVGRPTAAEGHKRRHLRGIHHAPAAESDDDVDGGRADPFTEEGDVSEGRLGGDVDELPGEDPGVGEWHRNPGKESG